jgi:tRNA A37 threonylcarbamoyladenosine synthetase subunit TsaC/SUA5/YrdC
VPGAWYGEGYDDTLVHSVVDSIEREAVVVYPTETIYEIGGISTRTVRRKIIALTGRRPVGAFVYCNCIRLLSLYSLMTRTKR